MKANETAEGDSSCWVQPGTVPAAASAAGVSNSSFCNISETASAPNLNPEQTAPFEYYE